MVLDRSTRLRVRRVLRRRQKQVESVASQAGSQFEDNFIGRIERLLDVKRFVIGWLFLVCAIILLTGLQTVALNQYYLKRGPVAGGVYNEGIVGSFSNANPIYATGPVDTSLSRLVFAGLFKFNEQNALTGDLASSYEVDESGKTYTVHLKPKLTWQDGKPLTSADVLFTYNTIQNADAKSPLFTSWQGISVTAPKPDTVVFTLPSALTAFPFSLTTGIIPKHILSSVQPGELRTSKFNTAQPVGAGPFSWEALQLASTTTAGGSTTTVSLKAFPGYTGGKPKLDGYILHVYDELDKAVAAFKKHSIEAIAGQRTIPAALKNAAGTYVYTFPTTAQTMLFLKTSEAPLNDSAVRKALLLTTNQTAIVQTLTSSKVKAIKEPVLKNQFAYDKAYEQAGFNPAQAAALLDQAGWIKGKNGVRMKDGQPLNILVTAEDTPDNTAVLTKLQEMWKANGITLMPNLQPQADFQSTVETHAYSALLYGISIGPDPDVFVYWHSSQADIRSNTRLNFSEYKSGAADAALEAGRTRQDQAVRATKYKGFLKAWQEDTPAIGLYQPNALYITRGQVDGLNEHVINTDADRYYSVANWTVKTGNVPK